MFSRILQLVNTHRRKILSGGILLIIIILIITAYKERQAILAFPWRIQPVWLLISFISYSAFLLLMILAWHRMILAYSGLSSWKTNFRVYSLSALARRIPTPAWYLGSRFAYYPSNLVPGSVILACSILEVSLLFFSGLLYYFFLLPFYSYSRHTYLTIIAFLTLIAVGFIVFNPKVILRVINKFLIWMKRNPITLQIKTKQFYEWIGIYLLVWVCNAVSFYALINGVMKMDVGFLDMSGVATLYLLLAYVSMFLTAGLGIKEIVIGLLLGQWMPFTIGVVLTFAFRILMTIAEFAIVLIGWNRQLFKKFKP